MRMGCSSIQGKAKAEIRSLERAIVRSGITLQRAKIFTCSNHWAKEKVTATWACSLPPHGRIDKASTEMAISDVLSYSI